MQSRRYHWAPAYMISHLPGPFFSSPGIPSRWVILSEIDGESIISLRWVILSENDGESIRGESLRMVEPAEFGRELDQFDADVSASKHCGFSESWWP